MCVLHVVSRHSRDMKRTRKCVAKVCRWLIWTWTKILTLNLHSWNMGFACRLHEVNIWLWFHKNPSRHLRDMEWTQKWFADSFDLELWPWPWTYTVEMCVLHVVSMRWISDTDFIKNPSRHSRDMEQTRKCVTGSFDLELWPWPWTYIVEMHVLHIVSIRWTSDTDFIKIHPGIQEIWSGHESV